MPRNIDNYPSPPSQGVGLAFHILARLVVRPQRVWSEQLHHHAPLLIPLQALVRLPLHNHIQEIRSLVHCAVHAVCDAHDRESARKRFMPRHLHWDFIHLSFLELCEHCSRSRQRAMPVARELTQHIHHAHRHRRRNGGGWCRPIRKLAAIAFADNAIIPCKCLVLHLNRVRTAPVQSCLWCCSHVLLCHLASLVVFEVELLRK
mmetsp:Transcript_27142/g.55312  ORF Transcript_27142/g.55312 Transcript_27142/m.55312 type:complete len:204 (+) Transcript_27142:187-798(+)